MNIITPIGKTHMLNENSENGFRPLPVRVTQHDMGNNQFTYEWVSAWQPSEVGLKILNAGGHIELRILGANMPPALLVETAKSGTPAEATLHDSFVRVAGDVADLHQHVSDILGTEEYYEFVSGLSESQLEDLLQITSVLSEIQGAIAQACSLFYSSIVNPMKKKEPANDDTPTKH